MALGQRRSPGNRPWVWVVAAVAIVALVALRLPLGSLLLVGIFLLGPLLMARTHGAGGGCGAGHGHAPGAGGHGHEQTGLPTSGGNGAEPHPRSPEP